MKKLLLIGILCLLLPLSGCETERSKEALAAALLDRFEAVYPNLNYVLQPTDREAGYDSYNIIADRYFGHLYTTEGGADIVLYSEDTNRIVYIDHIEGLYFYEKEQENENNLYGQRSDDTDQTGSFGSDDAVSPDSVR